MPVFLLGIVKWFKRFSLKEYMYAAAALALAFFVWQGVQFVGDKYEAEREVVRLEQVISTQNEAIRLLEEQAKQVEFANDTANAVREGQMQLRFSYDAIRRDAATAKEEEDGTVAPVLQRTLNSLDGLR